MAREDGVDIHLAQDDGAIGNFLERNDLEVFDQGGSVGAAMGLDQADDDVDALRRMRWASSSMW